jgi:outer membrane lipoprotein-sorting protein
MPSQTLHCLIAAAFTGAFVLGAQSSLSHVADVRPPEAITDDARALVQEEARAVQSIDRFIVSHQVDITSVTPNYNQTTHTYVKTWVQRPRHVRAESRQYTRSETIVSDGSTTWIYDGGNRTYWKHTGGAPTALFSNAFPGLSRQLSSANLPSVITSAWLAGTESLTINARRYQCDVVDVKVVSAASNSTLEDNMLHLWISQEYKVPLKVEATFVGATPADLKKYSDYVTDFEPNLNIPSSTWTFNPPPDAKPRTGTADPIQKN